MIGVSSDGNFECNMVFKILALGLDWESQRLLVGIVHAMSGTRLLRHVFVKSVNFLESSLTVHAVPLKDLVRSESRTLGTRGNHSCKTGVSSDLGFCVKYFVNM